MDRSSFELKTRDKIKEVSERVRVRITAGDVTGRAAKRGAHAKSYRKKQKQTRRENGSFRDRRNRKIA